MTDTLIMGILGRELLRFDTEYSNLELIQFEAGKEESTPEFGRFPTCYVLEGRMRCEHEGGKTREYSGGQVFRMENDVTKITFVEDTYVLFQMSPKHDICYSPIG